MGKPTSLDAKRQRVLQINELINTMAKYGRRFFYNEKFDRVAKMAVTDRGQIFWIDDYTGKAIYVAYSGHWRGFSHGGTLRDLVLRFADYIRTGKQLSIWFIGPERTGLTNGNIWGYSDEEIKKCRSEALLNPAVAE